MYRLFFLEMKKGANLMVVETNKLTPNKKAAVFIIENGSFFKHFLL